MTETQQPQSDTFERLRDILVESLGVEKERVTPDAHIKDDLNADSLDLTDLMMTIEEKFNLTELEDSDIKGLTTVASVVEFIDQHPKKAA